MANLEEDWKDKLVDIKICKNCEHYSNSHCGHIGGPIITMTGAIFENTTVVDIYPTFHYILRGNENCPFLLEHTLTEYGQNDIIQHVQNRS